MNESTPPTETPKPSSSSILGRLLMIPVAIGAFIIVFVAVQFITSEPDHHGSTRVRSDQRSLATAIETYKIDHGAYPMAVPITDSIGHFLHNKKELDKYLLESNASDVTTCFWGSETCSGLTTPIAYITSIFPDPFSTVNGLPFAYAASDNYWILYSAGPDSDYDIENPVELLARTETGYDISYALFPYTYDPTNGTDSNGDVWRIKQ
jgi:hypothetical protein